MDSTGNPWKRLSVSDVYENNWIRVEEHKVINPAGNEGIYGVVRFRNLAVGVIPVDKDLNTYLVGQYRYPLDQYSWEIPEGGGDPEVSAEETALRELEEETGLKASRIQHILTMHLSNSATNERAEIFLATGLTQGSSSPEETEQLQVRKIPIKEVIDMIEKGEITDSLTVAGMLKLRLMLDENRLKF